MENPLKSKRETYLEKVAQWRQGKAKKTEEIKKSEMLSKKEAIVKPTFKSRRTSTMKPIKSEVKPPAPVNNKRNSIMNMKAPTISKSQNKQNPKSSNEMLEKLKKWKEDKGKTDKMNKSMSTRPSNAHNSSTLKHSHHYKEVKSRLFDYKAKTKPQLAAPNKTEPAVNKENRPSLAHQRKPRHTAVKSTVKPVTHSSATVTTAKGKEACTRRKIGNPVLPSNLKEVTMKRRHSEISNKNGAPLKSGILKRKSCIGSFDTAGDGNGSQHANTKRAKTSSAEAAEGPVPGRRLSYTVAESPTTTSATHDIPDSTNTLHTSVPVVMVTPGVSSRNVRFRTPPHNSGNELAKKIRKTPKSAAVERRKCLDDWLKAKGRTPSKFRHLRCFHGEEHDDGDKTHDTHTNINISLAELNTQMDVLETERQAVAAQHQMNSMLDECMILYEAGCPLEGILPWLDDIYEKLPCAQNSARFYTTKANIIKDTLDIDAVLKVFEDATVNNAQPKEEVASCLTETVKHVMNRKVKEASRRCRTPRRSHVQPENVFESTKVVYAVSNVTPFSESKKRRRSTPQATLCQVVTPVRRSTRRSLHKLPEYLKDSNQSLSHLDELEQQENMLFQPNMALETIHASTDDDNEQL